MEEGKQIIASMRNIKDGLRIILTQGYVDESFPQDKEKLRELLVEVMGTIFGVATFTGVEMDEMLELVDLKNVEKKQSERMKKHAIAMGDFLEDGFTVLTGSPEEMLKQLEAYIRHAENLWENAVIMFQKSSYAMACFLSIVCIEECSKISFGEFQFYHTAIHGKSSVKIKPRGKNPLSQHNKKHFVAACSGALVNTGLDDIVGVDKVTQFIEDCESGKLERIRQMCLYADVSKEGAIIIPEAVVTKEQAAFYITVAGQLLSQIEGAESIRSGFQHKIDKFAVDHLKSKTHITRGVIRGHKA
jgi:AbiV family abortive infection protein